MRELYPIGTQLITRRLSQAALYVELFGDNNIKTDCLQECTDEPCKISGFVYHPEDLLTVAWRVTVTEENQKWLSPVPIVGDMMFPCVIDRQDGVFGAIVNDPNSGYWYRKDRKIILRTYPNGQRAPLLEWDEVILPEQKG